MKTTLQIKSLGIIVSLILMTAFLTVGCKNDDDDSGSAGTATGAETLPASVGTDVLQGSNWKGAVSEMEVLFNFGTNQDLTMSVRGDIGGAYITQVGNYKYSYNKTEGTSYTALTAVYLPESVPTVDALLENIDVSPVIIDSDGIVLLSAESDPDVKAYTLSEAKAFSQAYATNVTTAIFTYYAEELGLEDEDKEQYMSQIPLAAQKAAEAYARDIDIYFKTQWSYKYELSTTDNENDTLSLAPVFTGITTLGNSLEGSVTVNGSDYDLELLTGDRLKLELDDDFYVYPLTTTVNGNSGTISGNIYTSDEALLIGTLRTDYELSQSDDSTSVTLKSLTISLNDEVDPEDYSTLSAANGKSVSLSFDNEEIVLTSYTPTI